MEDWKTTKLQNIANLYAGGTPSTKNKNYWGGAIRWMASGEVNLKRVYEVNGRITELGFKNSSARIVPPNSILIGLAGQGKTRGTVAINKIELTTNQSLAAIVPQNDKINYEFLYYNLDSRYDELRQLSVGSGRAGLNLEILNNLKISFPPLPEQKKIAEILSTWDSSIETYEKLISAKQNRKRALMQRLLTGKQRFPQFAGQAWKEVRIGELIGEVARYIQWDEEELYSLVSIRRRFKGLFDRGKFYGNQIAVKKLKTIHSGDFLISKRQVSHGAWGVVTDDFHGYKVSDEYDCLKVKDGKKIDINFWGWFCKMPLMQHYSFLASNGVHIEKLIFDVDTFKKRVVVIPPTIEEQKRIAEILSACDREIELLEKQRDAFKQQKRGLMQKLLTGKVRVKIDGAEAMEA